MKGNTYDVIGNDIDTTKGGENITINAGAPAPEQIPQPPNKLVSTFKNLFNRSSNIEEKPATNDAQEQPGLKQKVIKMLQDNLEVEKSYKLFFIILSIGLGLICISLIFIPVIILSPAKFTMCFGLGSITILTSFIFLYGTVGYFEILFSRKRFPFTILFLASIVLGIYFAYSGLYIFSILCAFAQLISLIIFVLSFTPGGQTGIKFIGRTLASPFTNMWMRFRGQSYLPA